MIKLFKQSRTPFILVLVILFTVCTDTIKAQNVGINNDGSVPSVLLHIKSDDATNTGITELLRLDHTTSGAVGAGIGGGIHFYIEDAGGSELQSSIELELDNTTDAGEEASLTFNTNVAGTLMELMRIDGTSGNIGIRNAAPATALDIVTAGDGGLKITSTTANESLINLNATVTGQVGVLSAVIDATQNASISLRNINTTSTANAKISATTDASGGDPTLLLKVSTGASWSAGIDNDVSDNFSITPANNLGSATGLHIQTGGNVGIGVTAPAHNLDVVGTAGLSTGTLWTNTSDKRVKKKIKTIDNALSVISALRPVSYQYTDAYKKIHTTIGDKTYHGFIAQEFQEVFPDYINIDTQSNYGGLTNILQMNASAVQPYLVKAIQEQQAIIEKQEESIQQLNKKLTSQLEISKVYENRLKAIERQLAEIKNNTHTASQ